MVILMRWLRTITTSFLHAGGVGQARHFGRVEAATQAAVPSRSPGRGARGDDACFGTRDLSDDLARGRLNLGHVDANTARPPAMAAVTSGASSAPETRVEVPFALMIVRAPIVSVNAHRVSLTILHGERPERVARADHDVLLSVEFVGDWTVRHRRREL